MVTQLIVGKERKRQEEVGMKQVRGKLGRRNAGSSKNTTNPPVIPC
jgi:hypothetical protein